MKRLLLASTLITLPLAAQAAGELNLYVWSDSIAPELIAKFETETGIKVTMDGFNANEDLLTKLQASGCQFNRNGSWYTGSEAKAHLLRKLEYVEGKGTVQSTEHFIELAASKSSFSGRSYQVRCGGQAPVASQVWLIQQLAVVRAPTSSTIKP